MNTDNTTNSSAVFCAPLEDSCMEGQPVSEVNGVGAVGGESAVDGVRNTYSNGKTTNKVKEK